MVKEAVHKPTGERVAIKQYDRHKLNDKSRKSQVLSEIQILSKLTYPGIIKFHEAIESPTHVNLVMEHAKGDSLLQFIKEKPERKL